MSENQQVEWKESWRDEYLKWICGFANAQGGVLEIGRNDHGQAVGLSDAAKLMEDLPNKIRDILGIVPAVDCLTENGKDWIERMITACVAHGAPAPIFRHETIGLWVELPFAQRDQVGTKLGPSWDQVGTKLGPRGHQAGTKLALSQHQVEILRNAGLERALLELMDVVGRSDRTKFRDQVLNPLLEAGLIEMTIPEKPRSPKQKYRTTAQGLTALEEMDHE